MGRATGNRFCELGGQHSGGWLSAHHRRDRRWLVSYSLSQLQDLLRAAGWPDIVVNTKDGPAQLIPLMAAIGLAESGGSPTNDNLHEPNGSQSYGLWQINSVHGYSREQLHDPLFNAQIALNVYTAEGLRAWGSFTDGRYITAGQYNQSLALYQGAPASQTVAQDIVDQGIDTSSFASYFSDYLNPGGLAAPIGGTGVAIAAAAIFGLLWLLSD